MYDELEGSQERVPLPGPSGDCRGESHWAGVHGLVSLIPGSPFEFSKPLPSFLGDNHQPVRLARINKWTVVLLLLLLPSILPVSLSPVHS